MNWQSFHSLLIPVSMTFPRMTFETNKKNNGRFSGYLNITSKQSSGCIAFWCYRDVEDEFNSAKKYCFDNIAFEEQDISRFTGILTHTHTTDQLCWTTRAYTSVHSSERTRKVWALLLRFAAMVSYLGLVYDDVNSRFSTAECITSLWWDVLVNTKIST